MSTKKSEALEKFIHAKFTEKYEGESEHNPIFVKIVKVLTELIFRHTTKFTKMSWSRSSSIKVNYLVTLREVQ